MQEEYQTPKLSKARTSLSNETDETSYYSDTRTIKEKIQHSAQEYSSPSSHKNDYYKRSSNKKSYKCNWTAEEVVYIKQNDTYYGFHRMSY